MNKLWLSVPGAVHGLDAYFYTVSGDTRFPMDVLRAEAGWPATPQDAALISESLLGWKGGPLLIDVQAVKVPTPPRWHAQGWRIMPGRIAALQPLADALAERVG